MVYEGRIILYACTALTVIFLLAALLHFYRTRARVYLYFAAVFLSGLVAYALQMAAVGVADSLNWSSPGSHSKDPEFTRVFNLSNQLSNAGFYVELFSELLFHLSVLSLFGAWLSSMQTSLPSRKRTIATVVMRIGYFVFTFATLEIFFVFVFPSTWLNFPWIDIALCLEYAMLVLLLVVIVWLLVGLTRSSALHRSKKNQLWILVVLVVFSPPSMSFPVVMNAVIWIIPRILVVWPGALVGFDKAPDAGYQHEVYVTKV